MSAVTVATDAAPAHMIETIEGYVLQSDYRAALGTPKIMARCSCGWSVTRQLHSAVENQISKHRRQVA